MKVNFMGNLGNQMFCYAFGRSVSLARGIPLYFNRDYINRMPGIITYSMDVYDLGIRFGGPEGPLYKEVDLPFDSGVYSAPENTVFNGNWQTEKYFNSEVIRKELGRPNGTPNYLTQRFSEEIFGKNSVFVHVRRGDYTDPDKHEFHGCQASDYYLKGMQHVEERVEEPWFFMFSDDPSWCRQVFQQKNLTIVEGNRPEHAQKQAQWDIWLMSLCKHAVICNSSFGWWGAWLGDTSPRIVVAPKEWFRWNLYSSRDIVPERWLKI